MTSLRTVAALACLVLLGSMLRVAALPRQNRARSWLDRGSLAAREYQRFRERFDAAELDVLRISPGVLRGTSAALTRSLLAAPGVLEVVSPSALLGGWRDVAEHELPFGCDSSGACYHLDDGSWADARALHGPLSSRLKLLDSPGGAAHLLVLSRSQLDDSWGWIQTDDIELWQRHFRSGAERRTPLLLALTQHWLKGTPRWLLLLAALCVAAGARHSWRLALAAVGTAALAAAASPASLAAIRQTASIAEPSAELVVFLLVLAAALAVLSVERTRAWLAGAENPWRDPQVGGGRSALALAALALGSSSFAFVPIAELRAFGLQSATGLLLGAALVSFLLPALAGLLPRQQPDVIAPVADASDAVAPVALAPARRPLWQRGLLLLGVALVAASFVATSAGFRTFGGQLLWSPFLGYGALLFGLPFAVMLLRHGPSLLQRRRPLQPSQPLPETLRGPLDVYLASLLGLYAVALPLLLTAAPGGADRLGPESIERWDGSGERRPYAAVPLTRLELVLTTPESQLSEAGLARLARLAERLAATLPSFGVLEPSLLLREAAFQLDRAPTLPGPWLDRAGVIARLYRHYVADEGRSTRMTLLLEPPARTPPVTFAAELPLDAIAQQVKQELPDAQLTITGPERLVAEAAFDPLRLSAFLLIALALALSWPRLSEREVS